MTPVSRHLVLAAVTVLTMCQPRIAATPSTNLVAVLKNATAVDPHAVQVATGFERLDRVMENYDNRLYPTYDEHEVTIVTVSFHILSVSSIGAETMDYTIDIYLRQEWRDERLRHYNERGELYINDQTFRDRLWKPDLFFTNLKKGHFQDITVPNFYLRIKPKTGDIIYSSRLSLTLSCSMQLYSYPMDIQNCSMDMESYTFTTEQLKFAWKSEKAIQLIDNLVMPQFNLDDTYSYDCTSNLSTGEFPCLRAVFILRRQFGYHLIQSYLPTVLIVFMSWVSFWLDVDAIPARVTLGVTTLLTMTTLAGGVRVSLPPVSYIKAIDVWMGTCTIFVFGALLEFTMTNYLSRKRPPQRAIKPGFCGLGAKMRHQDNDKLTTTQMIFTDGNALPVPKTYKTIGSRLAGETVSDCVWRDNSQHIPDSMGWQSENSDGCETDYAASALPVMTTEEQTQKMMDEKHKKKAKVLDDRCRIIFPLSFFIFNIIYWPSYLVFLVEDYTKPPQAS
ncbi:PREDICTED: glycine receptor subunit alphaZ1-like isoform X2 [Priapulus caudatus]|uniref:Glycine receptor subunit alphaZ1-like isoform X2 n=1 Tax=Priapulus caudatus TaxID=37621 RepID=A0ABM1FBE6_PRICU|nr:PREDICTED: glycine receptor subunit alphaZ1-like isoform X2 [Priapulus caudatus]